MIFRIGATAALVGLFVMVLGLASDFYFPTARMVDVIFGSSVAVVITGGFLMLVDFIIHLWKDETRL